MKRLFALFVFLLQSFAFAGGVDTKANQSTGYLRNPSRNTECTHPEAVLYNIAGTAFMADGIYINLGNQVVLKKCTNEYKGRAYTDEKPLYFFPNFEGVYKSGKIAFFGSFAVYGGGGMMEYTDGSALTMNVLSKGVVVAQKEEAKYANKAQSATDSAKIEKYTASSQKYASIAQALSSSVSDHELSVYSATFGEQIGLAFNFNKYISAAACFRLLQGGQNVWLSSDNSLFSSLNGGNDVGYYSSGWGYSFVVGLHSKPLDNLDLSLQYQSKTEMTYEYTRVFGELSSVLGYEKGSKFKNDMSGVWSIGAGYLLFDSLYLTSSFNLYLDSKSSHSVGGESFKYNDSYDLSFGAEYQITSSIALSTGLLYNRIGSTTEANNIVSPALDNLSIGAGGEVKVYKTVWIEAGYMYSHFIEKDFNSVTLKKKSSLFSLGFTVKPF